MHQEDLRPHNQRITWLYLRCLGLLSLTAFISLWGQAMGLFGQQGIVPFTERVQRINALGLEAGWTAMDYLEVIPSLLYWAPSDNAIHLCFTIGTLASLGVIFNRLTGPMLIVAWLSYKSIAHAGGVFLQFQWDILLLELLLCALFLAPWTSWRRFFTLHAPPIAAIWMHRVLLFKLMFLSGIVKLLSQDEVWFNLSALEYHYWTQPIPHAMAYWVHSLPSSVHQASCVIMFVIELVLPFGVFGPRRVRQFVFLAQVLFQVGIIATGNYGFFNFLTIALCLLILDDDPLPQASFLPAPTAPLRRSLLQRPVVTLLCAFIILIHLSITAERVLPPSPWVDRATAPAQWVAPLRLFHSYGLFANMTEKRLEIIMEGSADGKTWKRYEFAFKPDSPLDMPPFINPHMPRLDWQMWFAALRGSCTRSRWYLNFSKRLLQNAPAVTALLGENPFPHEPPRYLRAGLHQYQFDHDPKNPQAWWKTTPLADFCPTLQLVGERLQPVTL